MAPFKPLAEITAAAWNDINSRPLSCLSYMGDLVEKYRSWVPRGSFQFLQTYLTDRLLDYTVDSIRSGGVNAALALGQKMDDLLNQFKVCRTTPLSHCDLWPKSTNILATAIQNHNWRKLRLRSVVSVRTKLGDQLVISHHTTSTPRALTLRIKI